MNVKILHVKRLLAILAVALVSASAALPLLPLAMASNCPRTLTQNFTLTSNCSYSGDGILLAANGITLNCAGYTLSYTGSSSNTYYGIFVGDGYVGDTVENCILTGAWASGIFVEASSGSTSVSPSGSTTVSPVTLKGNTVTGACYAFEVEYASNVQLAGNSATATTCSYPTGFYMDYVFNLQLSGNTAQSSYYGFYLEYGQGGSVTGNTATGNSYGFYLYETQYTLKSNKADSNTYYGFYDDSYGPGTIGLGNTYISNECHANQYTGSYDYAAYFGPAFLCTPQG